MLVRLQPAAWTPLMASLERTAYPRFHRDLSARELQDYFTPTAPELELIHSLARQPAYLLTVAVLLKSAQHLGYFPSLVQVPSSVVNHLRSCLRLVATVMPRADQPRMLHRHEQSLRAYLEWRPSSSRDTRHIAAQAIFAAAQVMDNPADLINAAVEQLRAARCELPGFATLNRLVERIRTLIHRRLFAGVLTQLTAEEKAQLDKLLETTELQQRYSAFHSLKQAPRRPSLSHLELLLAHLEWLDSLGPVDSRLTGIPAALVQHFAAEAKTLHADELREFQPPKRYTLLLCLIHRMRVRSRDDVVEMFLKRLAKVHHQARERLLTIQARQREKVEGVVHAFTEVLTQLEDPARAAQIASDTIDALYAVLAKHGGIARLRQDCTDIEAWSENNYLPLLIECIGEGRRSGVQKAERRPTRERPQSRSPKGAPLLTMHYVGLDVHKRTIAYCLKTSDGTILQEGQIPSTRTALAAWLATVPRPWTMALEATLFTGWIYDSLIARGPVQVADPRRLAALLTGKHKNDRIDARKIADALRAGLLPTCYMASGTLRELRRVLRFRNLLVRQAVQMKNRIAGVLMETGTEYVKDKLHRKRYFAQLLRELDGVPDSAVQLLQLGRNSVETLRKLEAQLVRGLLRHEALQQRVARLKTIPGVGDIVALSWALELGEITRFGTLKQAISYCGLCAAEHSSGGKAQRGPLSKERNKHLQTVLIEAAKLAPRFTPELARVHDQAQQRGSANRATVAVARKLVAWLWAVDRGERDFIVDRAQQQPAA